ncbi:unnamed protein product [Prorocentrum cordatum]|uniref:Uncharacterized protein n=1 Tax=Prorocentrum cordatum TaxID=2364126 RepID=A0ABN9XL04_9DINO|nr:unnamed protein product [Polarella glacialis]
MFAAIAKAFNTVAHRGTNEERTLNSTDDQDMLNRINAGQYRRVDPAFVAAPGANPVFGAAGPAEPAGGAGGGAAAAAGAAGAALPGGPSPPGSGTAAAAVVPDPEQLRAQRLARFDQASPAAGASSRAAPPCASAAAEGAASEPRGSG